jgi:uncharacterized protein YqjF (DUF2071 family)
MRADVSTERHPAGGDVDTAIVQQTVHRPWPLPSHPWVMRQRWNDLLFAHWPVPASVLRSLVPPAFELDTFDKKAWVGVVPFHISDFSVRAVPALPGVSAFAELNVRTYVTLDGKPGVYFFSLDAASAMAVTGARMLFNLPYYLASMNVSEDGGDILYRSTRESTSRAMHGDHAQFAATYAPDEPVAFIAEPGSLEYFLTERYCLYGVDHHAQPFRLDIHHLPWRLQHAYADIGVNTMCEANGIPTEAFGGATPFLHFSKRQDMVGWWPEPV